MNGSNVFDFESIVFWYVTLCSLAGVYWRFIRNSCIHIQDQRANQTNSGKETCIKFRFFVYSSSMEMQAVRLSETQVHLYQAAPCFVRDYSTFHSHRRETSFIARTSRRDGLSLLGTSPVTGQCQYCPEVSGSTRSQKP